MAHTAKSILARIDRELRAAVTPGPRMADEIECVASVMLAIVLAHLVGAKMISWAAFSAFVLMKGHISETLLRGILRLVGTAGGAGLALAVVPYAARSLPLAMVCAGVVGTIGLYGALTGKRSYAWLLFGLTFEMILLDKLEHPRLDTSDFARTRMLEVTAGTIACIVVSLVSTLTVRRHWTPKPPAPSTRLGWQGNVALHAVRAGLALSLLPLLHRLVHVPELAQSAVTIIAVMVVPVAGIGASGLASVNRKIFHRILGCVAGGLLAAAILVIAQGNAPLLIAGTCLGIMIGRHIENGGTSATYIGLQFTLAVLITLVPDSYATADIALGLARLASIFIGMAVLEPVLVAWHLLSPHAPSDATAPDAAASE